MAGASGIAGFAAQRFQSSLKSIPRSLLITEA